LATYKADTWLADSSRQKPRIAIVGVGSLYSRAGVLSSYGHELTGMAASSPDLKASIDRMLALSNTSMASPVASLPAYQLIGDCANRLILVTPPPGHVIAPAEMAEARVLIDEINAHLLTVTEDDLLGLFLRVIAGGVSKAHVLRALLRDPGAALGRPDNPGRPVEYLCTDSQCAQALLALDAYFDDAKKGGAARGSSGSRRRPGDTP
ncbi:MAG TPA: hypothetical protein VNO55_01895, partial [Polyangia bacterium]|nr:hypothetical protein [Polyangia bacterium]